MNTAAEPGGLAAALAASRSRLLLVAALFVLAGIAWWSTDARMHGMDGGPGSELGTLGWFLGVWIVMMAAMMFPSVAPTVALYARMARRTSPVAPLLFAAGYLVTWVVPGLLAYGTFAAGRDFFPTELSWQHAGRWIAGGTLIVAAGFELTPLKDVCLGKCRSPLGFLIGAWRDGLQGAFVMGAKHGAWCVGCCWALMASLFAGDLAVYEAEARRFDALLDEQPAADDGTDPRAQADEPVRRRRPTDVPLLPGDAGRDPRADHSWSRRPRNGNALEGGLLSGP